MKITPEMEEQGAAGKDRGGHATAASVKRPWMWRLGTALGVRHIVRGAQLTAICGSRVDRVTAIRTCRRCQRCEQARGRLHWKLRKWPRRRTMRSQAKRHADPWQQRRAEYLQGRG